MARSTTVRDSPSMSPESQVERTLRSYADRGVFRGFVARRLRSGKLGFSFRWLTEDGFRLELDPRHGKLTLPDLLPQVPYPSAMDRDFRRFLRERQAADLPEHRRIDPRRIELKCRNHDGSLSVELRVLDEDYVHATRRAISLVNEIFHGFLRGPYAEYTISVLNEPEE